MNSETIFRKPCKIFQNNKFSKKYVGKQFITWKCTSKNCNASIRTDLDGNIEYQNVLHTHEDKIEDVAAHKLKVSCKRKGENDLETPPSKVVRSELFALGPENETITTSDINAAKKSIWRSRKSQHGPLPTSVADLVDKLQTFPLSTSRKEDFLMSCHQISENQALIIFTCKTNLAALCESDVILGDGTFYVVPKFFQQLYTIHIYNNGTYAPVVFALLPDKRTETYHLMIDLIYKQCNSLAMQFLPKVVILDMEIAAINAFESFYDDIEVQLCHFHWAQAVFRHISEKRLKTFYSDPNSEIGQWLKLFFGLPLLPASEVQDAFVEDIMSDASQDQDVENFTDYVFETYIKNDARYPPSSWARMPDDTQIPTTTNGAEAFHRHFKKCFQSAHPNIYALAKELLGLQEETYVKLCSRNRPKLSRSTTLQRRKLIFDICARFRNGQYTRGQYLREISFKFLPAQM